MARFVRQYTSRDTSRDEAWYADIMGVALGTATVTVSTPNALKNAQVVYRRSEYFRKEVAYLIGGKHIAFGEQVTVSATREQSRSRNVFGSKTFWAFTFHPDGNMTSDGR